MTAIRWRVRCGGLSNCRADCPGDQVATGPVFPRSHKETPGVEAACGLTQMVSYKTEKQGRVILSDYSGATVAIYGMV